MKTGLPERTKVFKILPFLFGAAICAWGIVFKPLLREQETEETKTTYEEAFLETVQELDVSQAREVSAFGVVIQSQDLEENISLSGTQTALLKEYMNRYMESLAYLECLDFSDLFLRGKETLSESSITFQIALRQMTEGADYSLLSYRYVLSCVGAKEQEDGTVLVTALESSAQVFAQTPDVESKKYSVVHTFTMKKKNGEWYLIQHEQADCLYLVLESEGLDEEEIRERYVEVVEEYTELIRERTLDRSQEKTEAVLLASVPETVTQKDVLAADETELTADEAELTADHSYDRESALAYSYSYIYTRNLDAFADYSDVGGNCQNFVSQCLYAGGIPMDTSGDEVWKWYDLTLSNSNSHYGRSSSWTGVDEFVFYAENNSGYGLVAEVNAPYFTGEAGDVLQFGTEGDWRHAVLITDVVCDEDGSVIDYLVNSNTSNLENYPASLYGYPEAILTHIIGWNEEEGLE